MTIFGITVFGQSPQPNHGAGGRIAMNDAVFPIDYVALDLETTGFYPNSRAITEISVVRVREGHTADQFRQLVNPLRPILCQITTLAGITDVMVADLDPIDEVLPRFIARLATSAAGPAIEPIVGHSVSFDLRSLNYNTRYIAGRGLVCVDYDTMQISRALFPVQRHHHLADLIARFGTIDNEEHRTLSDVIQTQQCFGRMWHYVIEHHETEAICWKQAPAKDSAEILHQQLVVER